MLNLTTLPSPTGFPSSPITFTVYCVAFLKYFVIFSFSIILGMTVILLDEDSYSSLYSVILGTVIAILFIIFSEQIAYVFLLANNDQALIQGISTFIKYTALCIPFLGIGLPSTYLYQGLGKGLQSLFCTTFTEVICTIPATYLFAFYFNYGVIGIWIGFIVGRGFSSIINFIIARYSIRNLAKNEV